MALIEIGFDRRGLGRLITDNLSVVETSLSLYGDLVYLDRSIVPK